MSYTDKKNLQTYTGLLEGLSIDNKIDLIETLSKSVEKKKKESGKEFL